MRVSINLTMAFVAVIAASSAAPIARADSSGMQIARSSTMTAEQIELHHVRLLDDELSLDWRAIGETTLDIDLKAPALLSKSASAFALIDTNRLIDPRDARARVSLSRAFASRRVGVRFPIAHALFVQAAFFVDGAHSPDYIASLGLAAGGRRIGAPSLR